MIVPDPNAFLQSIKLAASAKEKQIKGLLISQYKDFGIEEKVFADENHAKAYATGLGSEKVISIPMEHFFKFSNGSGSLDLICFSRVPRHPQKIYIRIKDYCFAGDLVIICFDRQSGNYIGIPPIHKAMNSMVSWIPYERLSKQEMDSLAPAMQTLNEPARAAESTNGLFEIGKEFEIYVANHFRGKGYQVEERWPLGVNDEGIDLIATKGGEKMLIQCKYYSERGKHQISQEVLRKFYGDCHMYLTKRGEQGQQVRCVMVASGDVLDYAAKRYLQENHGEIEFMPLYYVNRNRR